MLKEKINTHDWVSQTDWKENIAAILTNFCRFYGIRISKKTIFENYSGTDVMAHFDKVIRFCSDWEIEHLHLNMVKAHLDNQFLPAFVLMKGYRTVLVLRVESDVVQFIDAFNGWQEADKDNFFENSMEHIVLAEPDKFKEEPDFDLKEKENIERVEKIRKDFGIRIMDDFMSSEECAYLVKIADGKFEPSQVTVPNFDNKSVMSEARTSSSAFLVEKDDFLNLIRERAAALIGVGFRHFEAVQVTSYSKGQLYEVHTDAFELDAEQLKKQGQRTHTILIYLNDDYEGGGTLFPHLELIVKAKTGRAVIWKSLNPDGSVNPVGYHGGLAVHNGRKYVSNIWVRNKEIQL